MNANLLILGKPFQDFLICVILKLKVKNKY